MTTTFASVHLTHLTASQVKNIKVENGELSDRSKMLLNEIIENITLKREDPQAFEKKVSGFISRQSRGLDYWKMEKRALSLISERFFINAKENDSLFINKKRYGSFIGATPDGIVMENGKISTIIEVKSDEKHQHETESLIKTYSEQLMTQQLILGVRSSLLVHYRPPKNEDEEVYLGNPLFEEVDLANVCRKLQICCNYFSKKLMI